MVVIGITGGIGAGKSMVLDVLEERYGAFVIQADQVGRQVMEPGQPCYRPILEYFGTEYLKGNEIDRKKLGQYVFANPEELRILNRLVHPEVKARILEEIASEKRRGVSVCVVEAAILLEAGYQVFCDEVWYIYAPQETRVQRLIQSRGYTDEYARRILKSQKEDAWYRSRADFTVDNSGTTQETLIQIQRHMAELACPEPDSLPVGP